MVTYKYVIKLSDTYKDFNVSWNLYREIYVIVFTSGYCIKY